MANLVFDFLHNYHVGERRDSEPANAYQYDEGHVIEANIPVVITSCEIHYWIRGMEEAEAYVPESITPNEDGTCTILGHVPNEYFMTNGELRVYIVVTDGDASLTTYEGRIQVCQRSIPDDYVDDDPDNEATRVLVEAREAAATATAAAETCEEVAASIPADYSEMSETVGTLSDDVSDLKSDFSDTQEWLGYPSNQYRGIFTTTHSNNWGIVQEGNDVTFTHKSSYTSGVPATGSLGLTEGIYTFTANYNGGSNLLSLYNGASYVKALSESETIIATSDTDYILKLGVTPSQGESVTVSDISFLKPNANGKIPTLENDVDTLGTRILTCETGIDDLQDGFSDISEPVISEITGVETVNKTINASGVLITAGADSYRVIKYLVTAGKKYWITACANYKNLLWCFYDSNDGVVQTGTASASGSTFTSIIDEEVTAPSGSAYIIITYNTTVKQGVCKTQTGYSLGAQWKGKKWVCVGDSLTAENERTTKHYFDYVAEKTGITTVNMGDSGSGYAREQELGTAFYQRIGNCPTDADVVTIFGSFNDLGAGLQVGAVDDTGTDTLAGCINTTIDNLQAVIPLVNLGIVAPTPWDTTQPSTSGQAYDYVEMLKSICERRSIPFLDLWRCSNLRPWDADFRTLAYSKDGGSGTHPDETGHKIIAPRFKAFLETLLM